MTIRLSQASIEKFETTITTGSDPTGDAVSFAFVASGTAPTSFTAGTWDGSWVNGEATAVSPTVGFTGSAASVTLAVGTYIGWVKVTGSPEAPVRDVGAVIVY